jgi:pilus assembly protein Flp/PilA
MSDHIKRFLSEDVAATAIEYGLIAALVSVGAMGAMTAVGNSVVSIFDFVAVQIDPPNPSDPSDPHQCVEVESNCNN